MPIIDDIAIGIQPVGPFTGHKPAASEPISTARQILERALDQIRQHHPRSIDNDAIIRRELIDRSREAAQHLDAAIGLGAPGDAIEDTRHALESLRVMIAAQDHQGAAAPAVDPLYFERAIEQLRGIEQRLADNGFVGMG